MVLAAATARTKASAPHLLILSVRISLPYRAAQASGKITFQKASTPKSYSVNLNPFLHFTHVKHK